MAHTIPPADYLDKGCIHSACYEQTIERVCLGAQGLKKLPQVGFEHIILPLVGLDLDRIHTPNGCIVRVLSDFNRLQYALITKQRTRCNTPCFGAFGSQIKCKRLKKSSFPGPYPSRQRNNNAKAGLLTYPIVAPSRLLSVAKSANNIHPLSSGSIIGIIALQDGIYSNWYCLGFSPNSLFTACEACHSRRRLQEQR